MLANKNIVVIGGTAGIGLSAALAFIKEGARVVVVGKEEETSLKASKILGNSARVLTADASSIGTAQKAIDQCLADFGRLDGLYHVAGGSGRKFGDGPLHSLTPQGWEKTIELNLTSLVWSNQAAIKTFQSQKSAGTILNMSSVLGYAPSPLHFATHAYAAAKGAVISLSKSLASYYAAENIRVNVIAPGLIETPMSQRATADAAVMDFIKTKQPLDGGRIGRPEDLDGLAIYFMSHQSRFTTGQVIAVDGGWEVSEGQHNS